MAIALTRTVEITSRQLVLAFAQSASGWLGVASVACSANDVTFNPHRQRLFAELHDHKFLCSSFCQHTWVDDRRWLEACRLASARLLFLAVCRECFDLRNYVVGVEGSCD